MTSYLSLRIYIVIFYLTSRLTFQLPMIKKLFKFFQKENKDLQAYLKNKGTIDQFLEYLEWQTHLPVPHAIKQNNIHKYQEAYQYQVFVETGTYLGDMVEVQKDRKS